MYDCMVTSGYLIEKTFARKCREYLDARKRFQPHLLNKGGYSTPRTDIPPGRMPKQYRGLYREPIEAWVEALRGSGVIEPTDQELEASLFLEELTKLGKAGDTIIFAMDDAREMLGKIEPPVEREIVWTRQIDATDDPPRGTILLGYEPSTFHPFDSDSPIADGMFFTCPMPNDKEGLRLKVYHDRLNRWGLFDTPTDAEEYLKSYLSSLPPDWDAHLYEYHIAEVRAVAD